MKSLRSKASKKPRSNSYKKAVNSNLLPNAQGQSSFISTIVEDRAEQLQSVPGTSSHVMENSMAAKATKPDSQTMSSSTSGETDSSFDWCDSFDGDRSSTVIRNTSQPANKSADHNLLLLADVGNAQADVINELKQKHISSTEEEKDYDEVPDDVNTIISSTPVGTQVLYDDVATEPGTEESLQSNNFYHVVEKSSTELSSPHQSDTLTSRISEGIYEPVEVRAQSADEGGDDWEWSSGEFEDMEDIEASTPTSPKSPGVFGRVKRSFNAPSKISKHKAHRGKSFVFDESKHPPPQLPDCPVGLTEKQQKRRHVVASIVEIENSYVHSLITLLEFYKEPLLRKGILPAEKVEIIFYKLEDVLDCHFIFRIALQDRIGNWDSHEMLGNEFMEFSKAMVLDSYSEFVNNFMRATDTLKKAMKEKAFSEFINTQMKASKDLLGPHGLMIKVIQRFPQYILQIKDLLKHTPTDHDDHLKLYMALSKLENVAYQLNEKKRSSEERLAANLLLTKFNKNSEMRNSESVLYRQDDVTEVSYNANGEINKQKARRLLLFNDKICLINIDKTGNSIYEKINFKWMCPVKDVEYHESGVTPNMNSLVRGQTGTVLIQSTTNHQRLASESGSTNENAAQIHRELDDLMHDQTVLANIMTLTSTLRGVYKGLNADLLQEQVKNVQTSIRIRDEQLQMLDSCSIVLSYTRNGQRQKDVFDMATPERKQDWVMDFRAVKLAQDKVNHAFRCWLSEEPKLTYPLVVQNMNVDITGVHTDVKCAIPIFLTNTSGGIGLQYLWVCSSNSDHGQVTLLSIHSNKPHIIESFSACDGPIDCCALVPSNIHCSLDHVWMSDSTNHVYIHNLKIGEWRTAYRKIPVPARVKDMCCYGNYVFLALADGSVLKYAKRNGSSLYTEPACKYLSNDGTPVNSLLPSDNNKIVAACRNTLYILSTVHDLNVLDTQPIEDLPLCIEKMIKLGLGIWFSCTGDPSLRLMHHETYKNISEIHIGNALHKFRPQEVPDGNEVSITALSSSQGLVWVGSSTGHILTIPVPVIEGIPQPSGKVNLSSVRHTGPVMFISTINCSITFAPRALTDEDMALMEQRQSIDSNNSSMDEELDAFDEGDIPKRGFSILQKRGSLNKIRNKVMDRLSGGLKPHKALAASTPNLTNIRSNAPGLKRSALGMYDSLMRLDDLDTDTSTTERVNNLVPTNPLPIERQCTKISTLRGHGRLRVTRSSSVSDIGPSVLTPLTGNKKAGVQSMWALNTTSSHSVFSEAPKTDEVSRGQGEAMDQAYYNMNAELRSEDDLEGSANKFGKMSSAARELQVNSASSILSRVAEDEEYIDDDDELSPLEESEFEQSVAERGSRSSLCSENDLAEESVENQDALVITNFLKASLIVSGGTGFMNLHEQDSVVDESSLIMWQQNQV